MFSILKSPYPFTYNRRENFLIALLVGIFVAAFLLIFEPFGISEDKDECRQIKTAGFGLVSFLAMLFFFFIIPRIFPKYFTEKNYTLGKDIIASMGLILLVAMGNGIYANVFLGEGVFDSLGTLIFQTFVVGIFPLSFLSLLQYNRQLKANLKASKEIQLPSKESVEGLSNASKDKLYSIPSGKEEKQIPLSELLYLESVGNYAYLSHVEDGVVNKTMFRTTLKYIEAENRYSNILRCHRSYIVNLDQVTSVNGNAQGLKLSLKDCEDLVPVSKKYIPAVKQYFA